MLLSARKGILYYYYYNYGNMKCKVGKLSQILQATPTFRFQNPLYVQDE